jgi:mono/diheme cytochrome c family protein
VKRWQKVALGFVLIIGALLFVGITATIGWRPFIGPRARPLTDRRVDATPARLARGEYVVRNVAVCLVCHSELDTATEGLPLKAGMDGAGRSWAPDGMPWLVAPNITPDPRSGAGSWSDDAIARAVREGVGHDGRALFPIMPYGNYRQMSDEDLASVIAYMRSLRPVSRDLPASAIPFPVNRLINSAPQPIDGAVAAPDTSTPAARGKYLTAMASCRDCHSPMDERGQFLPGMDFAGGNTFRYDNRTPVAAANLTPATNGIPYYTEDLFVETIRTGRVRERKISDVMPWAHYRGMTDEDLKAIFAYLKTLSPVEHYVDNAVRPTPCATCNLEHGGGERNKKRD